MEKKFAVFVVAVLLIIVAVSTYGKNGKELSLAYSEEISEKTIIENLKKMSKDELLELGLTEGDIKAIDEESLSNSSIRYGKVKYTVLYDKKDFYYDKETNTTKLTTKTYWEWTSPPLTKNIDIVKLGNSSHFSFVKGKAYIKYYKDGDLDKYSNTVTVYAKPSSEIEACVAIPVTHFIDKSNVSVAMKGSFVAEWVAEGNVNIMGIAATYSHTSYEIKPTIRIGAYNPIDIIKDGFVTRTGPEAYRNIEK